SYSALSELYGHSARLPGATRLTLFGACPWLSYSAPLALAPYMPQRASRCSALAPGFHIPRLWRSRHTCHNAPHVVRRLPLAFISPLLAVRPFHATTRLTLFGACPGFHIPRLRRSRHTCHKAPHVVCRRS